MDWDLYRKIIGELMDGPVERISPYLQNEPALDPEIAQRIDHITKIKNPFQYSKINSNGSLFTENLSKAILDSGLDRISFSVHGIEPELYEKTMINLKLETVLKNIDRFLDLKRSGNYQKPRVCVTMVLTNILEPQLPKIKEYWGARRCKVNIRGLESRGGHQSVRTHVGEMAAKPLLPFDFCTRLFGQIYIINTGEAIICCVDWERSTIMGDTNTHTIRQIWHNEKYMNYRKRFQNGDFSGMLCAGCKKEDMD